MYGVKKGRWSKEEVNFLKESYNKGVSAKEIGRVLGRTVKAVQKKIYDKGFKSSKRWTKEQETFLKNNFDILGIDGCADILDRTRSSIFEKATRLNLREQRQVQVWTEEDDRFLMENYTVLGVQRCADELGLDYHIVQHRAVKNLGIRHYYNKAWSDEEKEFLIENYPDKLGHYCAEKLDRSFHAVHKMVEKLELKPNWKYRYYVEEGYIMLCHDRENRILEHRYVVEKFLGRNLRSDEIIHHINEIKDDNRLENLMITNRSEHLKLHTMSLEERRMIEESRKLG